MAELREAVHSRESSPADFPAAATLALAAGMSLQEFVKKHSLLPFHRMVPYNDWDIYHGDPSRMDLINKIGTRVWRQSDAWFCEDCIKEDVESPRGFAYWRRIHQLPGLVWCNKHGSQLINNPNGKKAMDSMPSLEVERQIEFSELNFIDLYENQVIQRYTKIMIAFLDSEGPMHLTHARYRIAEQAKKHGLRIGERGKKPTLSDYLLEHVPGYWIKTLYPELEKRSAGEFFTPIDNLTIGRGPVPSYALALAAFFESSDEALHYWYSKNDAIPTERKTQRKFGAAYWNSTEIFKLYVANRGNHTKIAKALGIDPAYVRLGLNEAGLPGLGLVDMQSTAQVVLDLHKGVSLDSACESNGASKEEVEKLLRVGTSKLAKAIKEIKQPKIRKNAKSKK